LLERIKKIQYRSRRLRRHLRALARYWTPRRLVNLAVVESERLLGRDELKGRPYILIIDPLNTCNLKCPLCPTGTGNLPMKPGKMVGADFERFVDSIAPHTLKAMLYNWGEPFLHKEILDMIGACHKRRIATAISSNLNILPKAGAEGIVRSGLDDLIVSCDGISEETYKIYRKGGTLANVSENLRAIVAAKKALGSRTPNIEFQFLVFAPNEHEVPLVEEFGKSLGANEVRITFPYVDNETPDDIHYADNPELRKDKYRKPAPATPVAKPPSPFTPDADLDAAARHNPPPISCFWPWRSMVVNWNGDVDPCCYQNYHDSFGNVLKQPFNEVWNGPAYRYARRWITGKATNDAPMKIVCRGCGGYQPS
jgi:MoaA/NifB/PqqE/SkfB family radical SAM enzyme